VPTSAADLVLFAMLSSSLTCRLSLAACV